MTEIFTKNANETKKVARLLAWEILKSKRGVIIGLVGELGAGKTTFIQSFAKGMKIKNRVTSPSFVLIKKYNNLYHIDCYRIKSYKDILTLDFQEIISNPKNIVLIEWAEKIKKILPKDTIWIRFKIVSEKERRIEISSPKANEISPAAAGRNSPRYSSGLKLAAFGREINTE